jgi:hypothetical protein
MLQSHRLAALSLLVSAAPAFAQTTQDETGHSALVERIGLAAVPTGAGVIAGQVEASAPGYMPDANHPEFVGKTFNSLSSGAAISGHATVVGQFLYGIFTSIAPGIAQVDCYEASQWLSTGFLNGTGPTPPKIGAFKVLNHSWIGGGASPTAVLRKLDYAIENQGYVVCVGVNNGTGPLDVELLSHGYNLLSVGRSDGAHHAGGTLAGTDGPGRMKPEIVGPAGATSFSTPLITGAAALLVGTARSHPALILDPEAERPETIKAALMAGAEHRAGWSNGAPSSGPARGATATPLDALWGADEVDVNRSHWILTGGAVPAASDPALASPAPSAAWERFEIGSGEERYWRLDVAQTSPHASVLLTWNRVAVLSPSSWSMPQLELELFRLDNGQLVSLVGDAGLLWFSAGNVASTSAVDNLEHLYIQGLAPGSYVLEVRRGGDAIVAAWPAVIAWDVACPEPFAYGTGKVSSLGTTPELGWGSFASASRGEFELRVSDALPGNVGLVFWGQGQASLPLLGGTLLVQPPLIRLPAVVLDGTGAVTIPLDLEPDAPGQTRNYQFWFRDPTHPDGTGSGLTNAIQVPICD